MPVVATQAIERYWPEFRNSAVFRLRRRHHVPNCVVPWFPALRSVRLGGVRPEGILRVQEVMGVRLMIPNHRQLLGLLEAADPEFLAGAFTTDYPSETDTPSEAGTFTYFTEGFWDIRYRDGHRMLLAPWGSRQILADGSNGHGPAMTVPPRRPPWSLVLPRCSAFPGRANDEWQISADIPAAEENGSLTVSSLEHIRASVRTFQDP